MRFEFATAGRIVFGEGVLRETGPSLDWPRLLMRFGDYWRVLLSHLILFGFVYPDKRQNIPAWVMEELIRRLTVSRPNLQSDVCYGTLLSREQYLHDVGQWKYRDARQEPEGAMTTEQLLDLLEDDRVYEGGLLAGVNLVLVAYLPEVNDIGQQAVEVGERAGVVGRVPGHDLTDAIARRSHGPSSLLGPPSSALRVREGGRSHGDGRDRRFRPLLHACRDDQQHGRSSGGNGPGR